MKIQDRCMLVTLSISQWMAKKYDKKATKQVADHYGTASNAGRYNKSLIAQEHLKEIQRCVNALRQFHYTNTAPWNNNGQDILTMKNYNYYMAEVSQRIREVESITERFIDLYPDLQRDAERFLAGLYNAADYPTASSLRKKFSYKVEFLPVPHGGDFRVGLDDEQVETIQKDIEEKVADRTHKAMQDLWNRLYSVVGHMRDRLSEDGIKIVKGKEKPNVFRDSLVTNIQDLCELLPRLNVSGDESLDAMAKEIGESLGAYTPEELRENTGARKEAEKKAAEILEKVKGYMMA